MQIEDKFKLDVNSIEDQINARRLPSRIPSNGERGALHEGKKGCKEAKKSGLTSFKSPQSISCHIPFKKKWQNDPGFYSNYFRPMTSRPNHD